jgi:co-chaperonin GroES (HSP10)
MSWEEGWRSAEMDLSKLTPLHDFVLVHEIPEKTLLVQNGVMHMTGDYRWRSDRPKGLRRGRVVAVGRGDKILCGPCACEGRRAEMNVHAGDEVVYPRVPANDVVINGEEYTFLHEEQHVLAIVEKEAV